MIWLHHYIILIYNVIINYDILKCQYILLVPCQYHVCTLLCCPCLHFSYKHLHFIFAHNQHVLLLPPLNYPFLLFFPLFSKCREWKFNSQLSFFAPHVTKSRQKSKDVSGNSLLGKDIRNPNFAQPLKDWKSMKVKGHLGATFDQKMKFGFQSFSWLFLG